MTETQNEIRVARNHKDRLFRMIFREKKELLSLYNAVNGTSYTNAEDLEIVTLENAIYMNMKNDLAFIMDSYLNLYEHQSTYSPNMPLRDLFYIAKELGQVNHRDLYRNTLIKIPTPRFLVFYNGSEEQAEKKYLRLSDAFQKSMDDPDLELVVTMLNILVPLIYEAMLYLSINSFLNKLYKLLILSLAKFLVFCIILSHKLLLLKMLLV